MRLFARFWPFGRPQSNPPAVGPQFHPLESNRNPSKMYWMFGAPFSHIPVYQCFSVFPVVLNDLWGINSRSFPYLKDNDILMRLPCGALLQGSHFKEDSKRNTDLSLQLYKSIVGYGMWKILLHMYSNEEIEMLQISKRGGVIEDKDRHHLAIWHGEIAVPPFLWSTFLQGMTFDYSIVFFWRIRRRDSRSLQFY